MDIYHIGSISIKARSEQTVRATARDTDLPVLTGPLAAGSNFKDFALRTTIREFNELAGAELWCE